MPLKKLLHCFLSLTTFGPIVRDLASIFPTVSFSFSCLNHLQESDYYFMRDVTDDGTQFSSDQRLPAGHFVRAWTQGVLRATAPPFGMPTHCLHQRFQFNYPL